MALKPSVPGGAQYEVTFMSSSQSVGTTLLTVGWVPNHGQTVPATVDVPVAPAVTRSLAGVVPSAPSARRMEIRLDLPDGKGFGTLTLTVNGSTHAQDQLSSDTTWTCLVI